MKHKSESTVPPFRVHKATRQGYVVLNGRRVYLGRHDLPATKQRFDQLVAEWLASGRSLRPKDGSTVAELSARFLAHAGTFYRTPDGEQAREVAHFRYATAVLNELYGSTPAGDFGPLKLKATREKMIQRGWGRLYVNQQTGRVKRLFRWATENELISASVFHALQAVPGLRAGKSEARDGKPVQPIADAIVTATMQHVTPTLRAMIELQRLTGMRPGELVILRACDIDRSADVWVYRPARHKNQHRGHDRLVFIGPRGQQVLSPFLVLHGDNSAFVFSPERSLAELREARHAARKTPLSCGNRPGTHRQRRPSKLAGKRYDVRGYAHAICYGCKAAFPEPDGLTRDQRREWRKEHWWSPNRLRHSYATEIRRDFGLEGAQVLLGHARCDVSQVYAATNVERARAIAAKVG